MTDVQKKRLLTFVHSLNTVSAGGVAFSDLVPPEWKPAVMFALLLVAKFLPSFLGIGHRAIWGGEQATDPTRRAERGAGHRRPARAILVVAAALLVTTGSAISAERQVEIVIGQSAVDGEGVNGATVDGNPSTYSVRFSDQIGEISWLDGVVNLERTSGMAYNVDAWARVHLDKGRASGYLAGGLGGIWTDLKAQSQEVTVSTVDTFNQSGKRVTTTTTDVATVMTSDQSVGLRWSGIAGFQLYFTKDHRFGIGGEYSYSEPMDPGFVVDADRGGRIFLILPASGG